MRRYFNIKSVYGVETIDEINSKEFKTIGEFRAERKRLFKEYQLAGFDVYLSQRCNKSWRD